MSPSHLCSSAGRNNSVSAKGCINTTLMWRRVHVYDFFRDPKSKFEFTVDGVYYGEIPAHEDGYRRLKWCSHDNWKFCVTHFAGQVDQSVTIQFNGHDYYHKYANKFYHNDQQEDWLYEYWDCMVL